MARFREPGLYVVITESFCGGRTGLEALDAVLAAGVKHIQFREKDSEDAQLYAKALAFRKRTRDAGALLIVDDRADIALAVGADGVHLGQTDLPVDAARRIAPDLIIGGSSHDPEEARRLQDAGASYVNIGPVFSTQTKELPMGALGPEMLDRVTPHLSIPWTTMGGIKSHNIGQVLERGAERVAVVTAVTQAPDPRAAAAELHKAILARHGRA
jgi:thiamine-phosphate pyrophosphorylase